MPGLPVQAVASSMSFLLIAVNGLSALKRIRLRADIWERTIRRFEAPHIYAFTLESERVGSTATARMFAPALGISEAPATEAACGPLAAYLIRYKLVPARQRAPLHLRAGGGNRPAQRDPRQRRAGRGVAQPAAHRRPVCRRRRRNHLRLSRSPSERRRTVSRRRVPRPADAPGRAGRSRAMHDRGDSVRHSGHGNPFTAAAATPATAVPIETRLIVLDAPAEICRGSQKLTNTWQPSESQTWVLIPPRPIRASGTNSAMASQTKVEPVERHTVKAPSSSVGVYSQR